MGLDVYLETGEELKETCPHCGGHGVINLGKEQLYRDSITHNHWKMVDNASLYRAIWRPEELQITKAAQLIPILEQGLKHIEEHQDELCKLGTANDHTEVWSFVRAYLKACREHPDADIRVSR
jgi:hypothetical protein